MKHKIATRLQRGASLTALALIALSGMVRAWGGVAVFEGPPGGVGDVRVYDEQSGVLLAAPTELQSIRLLPIDFTGRTQLTQLLPRQARLRSDIPGASRILLPAGRGSLYRYARDLAGGGSTFGFMHIPRDGGARTLVEITGSGPLGLVDPFVTRIAVAPAGDAFLAASTREAGGNLLEIAIDGPPSTIDRTANIPPETFSNAGLGLADGFGVGVGSRRVLRFTRSSGAQASDLSFAPDPAPAFFSGQVVFSRSSTWAATTAGADATHLHMYAFSGSGALLRATDTPAPLSIAGFEPEATDGPFLAVSDDGETCAWRTEGATRECYVAHTQALPGEQPQHLTSTQFLDTVDEIGLFYFRVTGQLIMGVGATPAGTVNTMEKMDLYQVTLPAGGTQASIVNFSLTSGDAAPPFLHISQIKPEALTLLPDESHVIYFDGDSNDGVIATASTGQSGSTPLLTNVKSLDLLDSTGRFLMLSIRRSDGAKPQELYRMPVSIASPPALILSLPDGTQFSRAAPRRDGWMGFVVVDPGGNESLMRAHLGSGALQSYASTASAFGPSVFVTQLGSIAFSEGTSAAPAAFFTWPMSGPALPLSAPATPGQVLPGG